MQSLRYAPEVPLPAYAFVPGKHPHPMTDPRGHSFGAQNAVPPPLQPEHPSTSHEFLVAVDLFNAGFYWEAHEAWEGLWIAAGRQGTTADFLKGLIKLAAAGVKAREGRPVGVQRHSRRAEELFRSVQSTLPQEQSIYAGLSFVDLIQAASSLAAQPIVDVTFSSGGRTVIPCRLKIPSLTKS